MVKYFPKDCLFACLGSALNQASFTSDYFWVKWSEKMEEGKSRLKTKHIKEFRSKTMFVCPVFMAAASHA